MCGITAIFKQKDSDLVAEEAKSLISIMTDSLEHRGPDDSGIYTNERVALGSRRLSILDLSKNGHMPMLDKDNGNCIVHNGEVYNYPEIKKDLGIKNTFSNTDTEIILKSYAKIGDDCVYKFNGMYSFAIWDNNNEKLFLARDRLGIKPLFYAEYKNTIYVSSEIKSILKAGIPFEPNMKMIYDYLVYGVYDHSEETFFKNIKQVPAGFTLSITEKTSELKKYWDLDPDLEDLSPVDYYKDDRTAEDFLEIFHDSLKLRLRSDVPISVHISGGIDSSVMLSGINEITGGQGDMRASSYYYGTDKYDEKDFAEEIIKKGNWKADFFKFESSDVPELVKEVMWFQEQPFPGIITMAKHKLIRENKFNGAKVILEGQGGDDIGGGYRYVFASHILDLVESGNSDLAFKELEAFGKINGFNYKKNISNFLSSLSSYYNTGYSADGTNYLKLHCLNNDFLGRYNHTLKFPRPFKSHLLNMQYRDIRFTKLPRILRACDRASMASSKELRVPFLDHRLVEFMYFLPGHLKIRNGVQRTFMREAVNKVFPEWITNHPKKTVVDPQREWLQKDLSDWVSSIIHSNNFNDLGIFEFEAVKKEFQEYRKNPKPQNSFFLWQWISLHLWTETFKNV